MPPVLLKKNHNSGNAVNAVNAANEKDFWYKATILYIPYGQTLRDVLGLLYSLHVHKKSKFLFYNN